MTYPSVRYHKVHEPRVVHNVEEEELLGDEWKRSPAEFGTITAPSKEQLSEARYQAERAALPQEEIQEESETVAPRRRR